MGALLKTSTAKKSSPSINKPIPRDTHKKHIKSTTKSDRIASTNNKDKQLPVADDGSNRTATTDEKSSISSASQDAIESVATATSSTSPVSILWGGKKKSFADVLKKQQQV